MKFTKILVLVWGIILSLALHADEGMWLPSLLTKINTDNMHKLGAQLTADDIYNVNSSSLKDAVISLNGGSCTGELVSGEGLFLTNHHCGYGAIQSHSSEEQNILRDGFWAKTKAEELSNKEMFVSFLIRVEDVTDRVLANILDDMSESDRQDSINDVISTIVKEATDSTHYEAKVKSFYSENQYLLMVYETYRDVRLVGAPPHSIGKFGGDTDNWMWPRHTGDFSMFRIYTAPDGTPAEYAEDNVPLKPRHFLPISLKGYNENDFAMVMGYPGSTARYLTSDGVKYTMNVVNETRINVRKAKLDIIGGYMATSANATIQYASKYARSSNYYKYSIGQNRGLKKLKVVDEKEQVETDFANWIKQSEELNEKYGDALKLIKESYSNLDDDKAIYYISEAFLRGPELFLFAARLNGLAAMLKSGDSQEDIDRVVERLKERVDDFFKDYDSETDQKIVAALTEIFFINVDAIYYPDFIKTIESKYKGDYNKWAEKLFKKSFLNNRTAYLAFLENPKYKVLVKDPAYKAAVEISKMRSKARKKNVFEKEEMDKGYRLYLNGLLQMAGNKQFYPNANSTMRLTYGSVGGYVPSDAVEYDYYTTLKGYIEKEIPGDREFDVWPRLKELYYARDFGQYADADGTLHTCFTTNNDITGGNSGSPVINAKGELIGIAFDGNWEAMSGDIVFEPELQKCINVDIRFVLWVIDKFADAPQLVNEMKLVY